MFWWDAHSASICSMSLADTGCRGKGEGGSERHSNCSIVCGGHRGCRLRHCGDAGLPDG